VVSAAGRRVLVVAVYCRTNLTMRQLGPLLGVSSSTECRGIQRLGPLLALEPVSPSIAGWLYRTANASGGLSCRARRTTTPSTARPAPGWNMSSESVRQRRRVARHHSTPALLALAHSPELEVIAPDGRLRYPNEAMVGSAAKQQLRSITPDVVFLGADALIAGRGLCAPTLEQAQLKHVMLYAGRTAVVPAEHSKLGASPFPYWAPLNRPYTLAVDEQADRATVAPFRADGRALFVPVTCAPARPAAARAGQPGAVAG